MNLYVWARAEVLRRLWRRGLYLPPDRYVLERDILGPLASDPAIGRVLFVGVQWYTRRYKDFFQGKVFATIDRDPEVVRWGGDPHRVGAVQDLAAHFPGETFDAIVMTGVIGYGLDTRLEVDRALRACTAAIRPGGWLILGVDELRPTHVDPAASPVYADFEPRPFWGHGPRVDVAIPFKERRHTFLFWQKSER